MTRACFQKSRLQDSANPARVLPKILPACFQKPRPLATKNPARGLFWGIETLSKREKISDFCLPRSSVDRSMGPSVDLTEPRCTERASLVCRSYSTGMFAACTGGVFAAEKSDSARKDRRVFSRLKDGFSAIESGRFFSSNARSLFILKQEVFSVERAHILHQQAGIFFRREHGLYSSSSLGFFSPSP